MWTSQNRAGRPFSQWPLSAEFTWHCPEKSSSARHGCCRPSSPSWLPRTIVTHHMGRHSFNHALGIVNNGIITVALIGSVSLLVATLASHKQAPLRLLRSGAELWLTNVLVFSLWYWRLDGGGPNVRDKHPEFGSRSFVFPQMQIEKSEREQFGVEHWRPGFVDYLFIAFTQSSTFGPTDAPLLARWAKLLTVVQIFISLSIVILLIARAVGVL